MDKDHGDSWGLEGLGLAASQPEPILAPEDAFFEDLGDSEVYLPMNPQDEPFPVIKDPLSPWPPKLPLELALGDEDEDSILLRNNISPDQYEKFKTIPAFRRELAEAQKYIRENGLTFKIKCGRMAEEFLETLYLGFFEAKTGITTRHEIFKTITRLAELEPKPEKTQTQNQTQQVNIQINL